MLDDKKNSPNMKLKAPIILASQSPRRKELLSYLIEDFKVIPADIAEQSHHKDPRDYVLDLACQKAMSVFNLHQDCIVIGCDTVVVFEGEIFEKPLDEQDAFEMLKKLSHQAHEVLTSVCVKTKSVQRSFVVSTKVYFSKLSDTQIRSYIQSGEPMDKAGSYGLQGRAMAFVTKIDGSFSSVIGLPLAELRDCLKEFRQ